MLSGTFENKAGREGMSEENHENDTSSRNKRVTGARGSAKLRAEAKEGGLPRHDVLLESH